MHPSGNPDTQTEVKWPLSSPEMTSSTTSGILPAHAQRVAMECARAVPSRPLRRMVVILLLWTCFCYLIFKYVHYYEE